MPVPRCSTGRPCRLRSRSAILQHAPATHHQPGAAHQRSLQRRPERREGAALQEALQASAPGAGLVASSWIEAGPQGADTHFIVTILLFLKMYIGNEAVLSSQI